jgi:hypothetical protein
VYLNTVVCLHNGCKGNTFWGVNGFNGVKGS